MHKITPRQTSPCCAAAPIGAGMILFCWQPRKVAKLKCLRRMCPLRRRTLYKLGVRLSKNYAQARVRGPRILRSLFSPRSGPGTVARVSAGHPTDRILSGSLTRWEVLALLRRFTFLARQGLRLGAGANKRKITGPGKFCLLPSRDLCFWQGKVSAARALPIWGLGAPIPAKPAHFKKWVGRAPGRFRAAFQV